MKYSTISSLKTILTLSAAFAAVGTFVPSVHLVRSAQAAVEEGSSEADVARREMDEIVKSETATGQARAFEIASRLKLSSDEFIDFFKAEEAAGKRTDGSDIAWAKLLKQTRVPKHTGVSAADFESADIAAESLSAYIHLKKTKAADNFRVTPEDLANIQEHWTAEERTNYAKVLRRASEIASKGETATTEDAYQKALEELGFAEKANKFCKK